MKVNNRIPGLDGLRGISIIMVLLGHGLYSLRLPEWTVVRLLDMGHLGVLIFFVISGFLIYTLSVKELEETGGFSVRRFYIRRCLRILPLFYFYLIVVSLLVSIGWRDLTQFELISSGAFVSNYKYIFREAWHGNDYWIIGHYWTLTLEEQFYMTWPFIMYLCVRRRLTRFLLSMIVLSPLIRVSSYFLFPMSRSYISLMFHTNYDALAFGVLVGVLLRMKRPVECFEKVLESRFIVPLSVVLLAVVNPLITMRFGAAYEFCFGQTLQLVCISVLLIYILTERGTFVCSFLNSRWLMYVGGLSYSLYVWNSLFLYPKGDWVLNRFPYNYMAVFGAAMLSYYLIERPVLKLKSKFHKKPLHFNG